jgi:hypothetical protein
MVWYRPGAFLRGKDVAALREHSRATYRELRDMIGQTDPEAADFAGVFDAMTKFLREAGARHGHADAIPSGSLTALPRIGMFYGCRIGDAAMRRRLFATFRTELARLSKLPAATDEALPAA